MGNQITLRIHNVKCVDETGGGIAERVGNDEIFLGGFGIDGNGQTVKVGQTEIYAHFDGGDVKKFSPPRRFTTLRLPNNGGSVSVGLLLVEKDGGGMRTALEKIYTKVVEEMTRKKREEMARRRVSNLTGADVDWRAIWEVVKPIIVNYVKEKIVSAFNDDLFPLQSVSVTVGSSGKFGNGRRISPPEMVEFRGHDGIYRMNYDWEIV